MVPFSGASTTDKAGAQRLTPLLLLQMERIRNSTKSHKSYETIHAQYRFINSSNVSVELVRDYGFRTLQSLRFVHIPKTGR
jgi:hypothetical protein